MIVRCFLHDFNQNNVFFINKITSKIRYSFSECRLSQKDAKLYACLVSWLGACLQERLRLPSLRTRAAQHPHTLQTQNTRFKHNTAERNRTNDGGQPPIVSSSIWFCCVVFEARVCCALLRGARVLYSFVSCTCKRQTGQRTCRQAPSQEIRQA